MILIFSNVLFTAIPSNAKTLNCWENGINFNIGRTIELEIMDWLEHEII